jgi:polysaccharide deacetylase family protein (PEP-CTERM system associated)
MLNALTIDVEDYYQVSNFERQIDRSQWDSYPSRVVASTQRILDVLQRRGVHATFFVLGFVADKHPDLVREIDAGGHEIASHGYWHRRVDSLTEDEFRTDLRRSRETLEAIVGKPVTAFRAPSFSITEQAFWALDVLVEEGFTVDSSLFPRRCARLGHAGQAPAGPGGQQGPITLQRAGGELTEFPIATYSLGRRAEIPVCGGGYFRLFPLELTHRLLHRVNHSRQIPFTFYIHPWEFDPDQPRVKAGSAQQRFRHYVNLKRTEAKFDQLLDRFRFGRLDEALAQAGSLKA